MTFFVQTLMNVHLDWTSVMKMQCAMIQLAATIASVMPALRAVD